MFLKVMLIALAGILVGCNSQNNGDIYFELNDR